MTESPAVALVACACLLAVGAGALGLGYQTTGQPTDATETVPVNYSTTVQVSEGNESFGWEDDETVTNSSDAVLVEGADYQFDAETGNLEFFNTSNTTAGANATIEYRYNAPAPQANAFIALISGLWQVLGVLLWPLVAGLFLWVVSKL